jgi:AcrR family transcriptional regulator
MSAALVARAERLGERDSALPASPGGILARSRSAILAGAGRAVEVNGTRVSMAQIAAAGGVAKATLYNHFRSREDVLNALLIAEIDRLIGEVAHLRLPDALTKAAIAVSNHPLLESLGGEDTATLAVLARVDIRTAGWLRVAEATEAMLSRSGRRGGPMVLRWLSSFLTAPAEEDDIRADVEVLVAGLPPL